MQYKKIIVISFLVGVLCSAFAYQIYVNYQFQKFYSQDHATLEQVVQFLNANIEANKVK